MTSDIIRKLGREIRKGITTEAQVVYLIVCTRKLLEQQREMRYEYLKFYCDWALHSKLEGRTAQKILEPFDAANVHLLTGIKIHDLPGTLRHEIDRVSEMKQFESEFSQFLQANGLPGLEAKRSDGWIHFLHLYAKVIEDCPLVIKNNSSASISKVTLNIELAKKPTYGDLLFKVRWIISDKNGHSGEIFVINSFSLNPGQT